jgi:hypothetical protein
MFGFGGLVRLRHSSITKANAGLLFTEPIPLPDRDEVRVLVQDYAARLWSALVHPDPERFRLFKMPEGHWWRTNEQNWMGWHESANHPKFPDSVGPALQRVTGWADADLALYMPFPRIAYRVPWGVFLRQWRAFLWFNDEPLLLRPGSGIYICFGSPGDIGWGYRPVHEVEGQLEWVSDPETVATSDPARDDGSGTSERKRGPGR